MYPSLQWSHCAWLTFATQCTKLSVMLLHHTAFESQVTGASVGQVLVCRNHDQSRALYLRHLAAVAAAQSVDSGTHCRAACRGAVLAAVTDYAGSRQAVRA